MPHGYTCDRCGEFVEQDKFEKEVFGERAMPMENVGVVTDTSSDYDRHDYTLCPQCRRALVAWVEQEVPAGFLHIEDVDADEIVEALESEMNGRNERAENAE